MIYHHPSVRVGALVLAAAAFGLSRLAAADLGPVSIHGSASFTFAYSPEYNYLGDSQEKLGLVMSEAALNANFMTPFGARLSAQLYAYKLEDFSKFTVDFLNLDYAWKEWLGVRLGRNRTAGGLYNESRDVDAIRVFAFLPLGVYDPNFRPLRANHDGIDLYGNIALGAAGSLEYQIFYGELPKFSAESNFIVWYQNATPLELSGGAPDKVYGYAFVWNTPLDGLRLSGTEINYKDVAMLASRPRNAARLSWTPSDFRMLPLMLPPGLWDGMIAGGTAPVVLTNTTRTYSAEFTWRDWVFAGEWQRFRDEGLAVLPVLGNVPVDTTVDSWYVSASWQATKRLGLGAYYEEFYPDANDKDGSTRLASPRHAAYTKGWTLAASYKVTDWWLIKAEGHFLSGTAVLRNDTAQNGTDPNAWTRSWSYFVLKNTFSF